MTPFLLSIIAAYLLGSIPFGVLIARAHGKDIREIGSGNIGATNVSRMIGKKWGYVCFGLDCLKGLGPMVSAGGLVDSPATVGQLCLWVAVGCAAIVGHIFPVYLRFKGGKGVATSLGMVLGLYPYYTVPGVITFAVWGAFVLKWRYVSLASIAAAVSFPVSLVTLIIVLPGWEFAALWPLVVVALAIPAMVVVRHTENIKRLREGTEERILQRS